MRNQILILDFYPTYYQMGSMFWGAAAFNQYLSTFNTSAVTRVSLCVESNLTRNQILIIFYPTYYQMYRMFGGAAAFNQPLSTFDTAKVTYVSIYLCRV